MEAVQIGADVINTEHKARLFAFLPETDASVSDIEEAVDKATSEMPKDYEIRNLLIGNRAEGTGHPGDARIVPTEAKRRQEYVHNRV